MSTPEPSHDRQLVEAARRDPAAFGEIFDRYYGAMLSYAIRRTGRVEIARDIVSEVFLKALRGIHGYRWRGLPLSSWLYRITANEIATWYRKGSYAPSSLDELREVAGFDVPDEVDLLQEVLAAEREMERHREFRSVQRALLTLPLKYQETLALRYFQEKSIRDVASILGRKEGTVKSLLSRGIARLRQALEQSDTQQTKGPTDEGRSDSPA